MKLTMTRVLLMLAVFAFVSCGGKKAADDNKKDDKTTETTTDDKKNEPVAETTETKFKKMIVKGDKPVTWEADNEKEPYIFFRADGTFGSGDNGGEESMDEGKWKIEGEKLMVLIDGKGDEWMDLGFKMNSETSITLLEMEFTPSAEH